MAHYQISNRTSGADMGVYEGADADEALLAMARDAGAASVDDRSDWIIAEV